MTRTRLGALLILFLLLLVTGGCTEIDKLSGEKRQVPASAPTPFVDRNEAVIEIGKRKAYAYDIAGSSLFEYAVASNNGLLSVFLLDGNQVTFFEAGEPFVYHKDGSFKEVENAEYSLRVAGGRWAVGVECESSPTFRCSFSQGVRITPPT